ncbi:hypothetical protein NBH00_00165 [Paraconexibacter antarcticus]|uniref:Uncharacterized protein n=1 Tax=Paraconexibacter antarcticus TaxID=2949664 RepID=A0ABY5DSR6_9ACTN|nr:hypothetical protein [Paraconexibacter antarcticus]UTI64639.1 hypothetical protein NBH00_00165 [Paraconexibacter antarcticus]
MSIPAIDPAVQRMLAGEVAKQLWASAKPQATDSTDDTGGDSTASTAADTYGSLFTDVLADALAGTKTTPRSAR